MRHPKIGHNEGYRFGLEPTVERAWKHAHEDECVGTVGIGRPTADFRRGYNEAREALKSCASIERHR